MKFSISPLALLADSTVPADPKVEVYFSTKGDCTDAVVDSLSKTKSNVLVQAYLFTLPAVAKALSEAHGRGVKVVPGSPPRSKPRTTGVSQPLVPPRFSIAL